MTQYRSSIAARLSTESSVAIPPGFSSLFSYHDHHHAYDKSVIWHGDHPALYTMGPWSRYFSTRRNIARKGQKSVSFIHSFDRVVLFDFGAFKPIIWGWCEGMVRRVKVRWAESIAWHAHIEFLWRIRLTWIYGRYVWRLRGWPVDLPQLLCSEGPMRWVRGRGTRTLC